jgi:hypothetical protein
MPTFAIALLILGFSCVIFATALVFIFKLPEASALNLLAKGSFVYRNLQSYVAVNWVKPIYSITYIGLSCILIAIFGVLIANV